ncbi:MAG: hypothetical protein ACT6S0_12190 [Roseateles sp.]
MSAATEVLAVAGRRRPVGQQHRDGGVDFGPAWSVQVSLGQGLVDLRELQLHQAFEQSRDGTLLGILAGARAERRQFMQRIKAFWRLGEHGLQQMLL